MQTSQETLTAAELLLLIEEGHEDEALARIQSLCQMDFIRLMRSVQTAERALSRYAESWRDARDWGNGAPFPDEQKALAKAA